MPFVLGALWRLRSKRKRREQRERAKRGALLLFGTTAAGWLLTQIEKRRRRDGSIAAAMKHGAREAASAVTPTGYDDKTLEAKVSSELFRPEDAPKGQVNVQVVDGVVELRGKLDEPDKAAELASRAERIEGVSGVRNLINA